MSKTFRGGGPRFLEVTYHIQNIGGVLVIAASVKGGGSLHARRIFKVGQGFESFGCKFEGPPPPRWVYLTPSIKKKHDTQQVTYTVLFAHFYNY